MRPGDEVTREQLGSDVDTTGHRSSPIDALATALRACMESAATTLARGDDRGKIYPTEALRTHVRDCVRDYTAMARAAGAFPEQALRSVKAILHDAAPSIESYSAIASDVSRWCIEAYFEPR